MLFLPVYPSFFLPSSHLPSSTTSGLDLTGKLSISDLNLHQFLIFILPKFFLKGLRFLPLSFPYHKMLIPFPFFLFLFSHPSSLLFPSHPFPFLLTSLSLSREDTLRPKASWWSTNETFSFAQELSFNLSSPGFSACLQACINTGWI